MKYLIISIIMFCNSLTSFAQWEQVAPPDARVISLYKNADSLYFYASNGTLFKVKNSVDSFSILKNAPFLNSLQMKDNILYGAIGNQIWSSADDGKTWTMKTVEGVSVGLQIRNMQLVGNKIFISDYINFGYSEDNGATWKIPSSGFVNNDANYGLNTFITFDNTVIIKGWGSKFFISNNGGKDFISRPVDTNYGYLEKSYRHGSNIYFISNTGTLIFTEDTCKTWKQMNSPNQTKIVGLDFFNNRLYIRTLANNIFYTENNGIEWTDTGFSSHYDTSVDFHKNIAIVDSLIYINTIKGWLRADPSKFQNFSLLNKNLLPKMGFFMSSIDDKLIFNDANSFYYNRFQNDYTILDVNSNYFYLANKIKENEFILWTLNADYYYKTTDDGVTFSKIPTKMKYDVLVNSGIKTSDYILFIKNNKKSLMRYDYVKNDTMNLSFPWSFDNINNISAIAVKNNVFVVAGSVDKLSISNDYGNTWTHTGINFSSDYGSITSMTYDNNRLIAYTSKGYLCYSHDNGMTWTELSNHSLIPKNFSNTKLVNKGKFIVVGGYTGFEYNNAVYSVDGGATFNLLIDELKLSNYPEKANYILSFTSSDKYLWVGTTNGVFRYDISEFTSGIFEKNTPETDKLEYTISPNPVIDQFSITTPEKANYRYIIYSVTGEKILSGKFIENTDVDLNHFDPGLYYLTIFKNENTSSTQKFIKM